MLQDLYRVWALWRNYFQPVMRLASKTRTGSKVHRTYDTPATPCQRLLASGQLTRMARQTPEQHCESLNPILLRKQIEERQHQLHKALLRSPTAQASNRKPRPRSVSSFVTQRSTLR